MSIEKEGTTHATDIRDLVRQARAQDGTLVVTMKKYDAVVVVATGKKAGLLKKLTEEFSEP
jgi:hypothetical protein